MPQPFVRHRPMAPYVILVAFCVTFGALTLWSWRRLRRAAKDDWGRTVYGTGVRGFGSCMWVWFAVLQPIWDAWEAGEPLWSAALLADMLFAALIGAPIALWGGYWFGRSMAAIFGIKRPGAESSK